MTSIQKIQSVDLSCITTSHNPRRPCPVLQDALANEGHADCSVLQLVHKLALSTDPALKAEFVRLIETYEGSEADSIVGLANSRQNVEIHPIWLREFRSKQGDDYVVRYGIVSGERRTIAAAYNHAKHGLEANIGALVAKLTVAEAYERAIAENAFTRKPTDLENGRVFHNYRQEKNPATGKNWSLKEIAAKLGFDYQYVRGREALLYLPEADQRRIDTGKVSRVGVTKAIQKGLSLKRGKKNDDPVADKKANRQRTLSLSQTQALFDQKRTEQATDDYLQALSDVMQVTLKQATKASDARIEALLKSEAA